MFIRLPRPNRCKDCEIRLELQVLHSMAGYYVGTICECGPYSRESEYFRTRKQAEQKLKLMLEE